VGKLYNLFKLIVFSALKLFIENILIISLLLINVILIILKSEKNKKIKININKNI